MVVFGGSTGIGEVAAAVAGCQQLPADTALPLKEEHFVIVIFGSFQRGHYAGGASAHYSNSIHRKPVLSNQRLYLSAIIATGKEFGNAIDLI